MNPLMRLKRFTKNSTAAAAKAPAPQALKVDPKTLPFQPQPSPLSNKCQECGILASLPGVCVNPCRTVMNGTRFRWLCQWCFYAPTGIKVVLDKPNTVPTPKPKIPLKISAKPLLRFKK